MKLFAALALITTVSANPLVARGSDGECGVAYHIFPQTTRGNVYIDVKRSNRLPDYTNTTPQFKGITHKLYYCSDSDENDKISIYSTPKRVQPWQVIVNHQFYIKPCMDGKIKITVCGTQDDLTAIWVGTKAYRNFELSNADLKVFWDGRSKRAILSDPYFTINATKDEWIPVRIIGYNGKGRAAFRVRITGTAPSGKNRTKPITLISPDEDEGVRDIFPTAPKNADAIDGDKVQPFPGFPFQLYPPPPPPPPPSSPPPPEDDY